MVTCESLLVCDVALDVGEEIQNVAIGDSEHGIVANAIITTNCRTYYLGLVSKAKRDSGYCVV